MGLNSGRIAAEVEVKLEAASPEVLRHIAALDTLGRHSLRRRPTERLHSLYLDTADLALARAGVALRLRRSSKGWEATIKWMGRSAGSLHERPELNVPLPARPRMPFALPPGPLYTQLAATVLGRPLQPILASVVQRQLLDIVPAAGTRRAPLAEIALDTVQLRAPDGHAVVPTYCEVEIEQRACETRELTALSHLLQQRFGLIPSRASKFARGLTARYGPEARSVAALPIRSADPVGSAARTVIAAQLARLRASDPGTRLGEDAEALHDMRVAVRRLRAATRMFRAALPTRAGEHLRSELQWLGHELGAVRDLDVQIANLAWYRSHLQPPARRRLEALGRYMRAERAARRAALVAALESRRYFRLLGAIERFALGRPPRRLSGRAAEPVAELGRRAIKKALGRLKGRGDAIGALPDAADLHAVRIRAKRLRYLLEALRPISGAAGRKLTRQLIRLQDVLGRFNDAMVAAAFIRNYASTAATTANAETQQVLAALADAELRRAGAAQGEFQRAWNRFTSKRARGQSQRMLKQLKAEARQPVAEPGGDTARREAEVV